MPPAAISRSSTYFPKICGNIAAGYRSAFRPALLAVFGALGCAPADPKLTTLAIRTHELGSGCALASDPAALADYTLALTALGPFPADGSEVAANIRLDDAGRELAFDARTTGVDAIVTGAGEPTTATPDFAGYSERRDSAGIDVLLWPNANACTLSPGPYPGTNPGQALGYSARTGLVLSAGEDVNAGKSDESAGPGSSLVFDADSGDATVVPREGALRMPRAFASVSAFGDDLLVAGGENPLGASSLDPSNSAEVFSAATRGFVESFELILHRSHHASVTLPGSGETLLIGGIEVTPQAPAGPPSAIRLFEAVFPAAPGGSHSSISELAELNIGRVDPTALVLDDGRIFVGGGTPPDPDGPRIGEVEYFSPDGRGAVLYAEPKAREHRVFAPLPGSGVLSVASCSLEERDDCSCVDASGGTCDPTDPNQPFVEGLWIDPEGNLESVAFVSDGAAGCPTPARPLLAQGSDGSPWLVAATDDGSPACLWRFQPWPGELAGGAAEARPGPRFVPTGLRLEPPPDPRSSPVSLGPDAFVWVAASPAQGLAGVRLGHRGPLTRDGELLAAAPDESRPRHLAPDHDPNPPFGPVQKGRATFDANFQLKLAPSEPPLAPLTVWVADARYDDATVSIALGSPPAGTALASALPVLVFGVTPVGDDACRWPAPTPASSKTEPLMLRAARAGSTVTLSVSGISGTARCTVASGPLPVGVRAGAAETTLVSFSIERE